MTQSYCHPEIAGFIRDFGLLHQRMCDDLWLIRDYHSMVELKQVTDYLTLVEKRPLKPEPDMPDEIWNQYEHLTILYNEASELGRGLGRLVRSGLLFSTISLLEGWMMEVCGYCASISSRKLSPRHLRHEGLRKMIVYLEGVCGVDITVSDPKFEKILAFGQIKNVFSHSNGVVADRKQLPSEVSKIVSDAKLCSWAGNAMTLEPAFCAELFETVVAFTDEVSAAIVSWINLSVRKQVAEKASKGQQL